MLGFINKIFGGSKSDKDYKKLIPAIKDINEHYDSYQGISNDELRNKTIEFKERIKAYLSEIDKEIFDRLNLNYSKDVWKYATQYKIPLVYASSAATYGLGEHGYDDSHRVVSKLQPLNPYGDSKNDFDKWVLTQHIKPPFWAGLKFFNVYGPNEYHKARMASVVLHAYRQITRTGKMKLFRSHNDKYDDGGQKRDFIYVKDVHNICTFLMEERPESGLYNVGSGKARTFKTLAVDTFHSMNREVDISYIDTPADIRDKYQYFTEAKMNKLIEAGYSKGFHTLEQGVKDYVENYLMDGKYL